MAKLRLNIGCEKHILPSWENLDNRQFEGAKYWSWNDALPYDDDSVDLILIQHSLMYLDSKNYSKNFQEIYRVLYDGGKVIIKEEDSRIYQWRKLGTKHRTGHIIGSTNPVELSKVLIENKFKIINTNPHVIVNKYGNIINRLPKLFKGKLFVVEAGK